MKPTEKPREQMLLEYISLQDRARQYLLKEHLSPLNNILHQCDLKTEFQYHKDIENAFIKGAEWRGEQIEEEKKEIDEQWKRLMAESKSIGVDLLQCKDEQIKKENQELRHQIRLLIDAIDHAYLRLDGTYRYLAYEVSDQVKYVKSMQIKELKRKQNNETRI